MGVKLHHLIAYPKVAEKHIRNNLAISNTYTAFDLKEKMFQDTGLTTLKSYWSVRKVAGPTNCRVLYNVL